MWQQWLHTNLYLIMDNRYCRWQKKRNCLLVPCPDVSAVVFGQLSYVNCLLCEGVSSLSELTSIQAFKGGLNVQPPTEDFFLQSAFSHLLPLNWVSLNQLFHVERLSVCDLMLLVLAQVHLQHFSLHCAVRFHVIRLQIKFCVSNMPGLCTAYKHLQVK